MTPKVVDAICIAYTLQRNINFSSAVDMIWYSYFKNINAQIICILSD
uniref:Uncharacterized protein n=1 Tax=Setaria italica TaxID=4555 RepID=K3Y4A7_SETIT